MIKTNISDRRPRREKFKREVVLLSGGCACPTAFPDGKIVVYPWDSTTDHWLTETASKATGHDRERLMFDLMARVCNLNGCALEDFILSEVNSVLLVSRAIQNQNKVAYVATCPKCNQEEDAEVLVPDDLQPVGAKTPAYKGVDTLTLTACTDVVEVRPLRIRDHLLIVTRTAEHKDRLDDRLASLLAGIVTVGGSQPDRIDELVEWYLALPPQDAVQLEAFLDNSTPHLSQDITHKCDKCGNLWEHRLALDQDFFRSGRSGTPRRALAANL